MMCENIVVCSPDIGRAVQVARRFCQEKSLTATAVRGKREPAIVVEGIFHAPADATSLPQLENLARIHDTKWIQRVLDRAHGCDRSTSVLGFEKAFFALADPV